MRLSQMLFVYGKTQLKQRFPAINYCAQVIFVASVVSMPICPMWRVLQKSPKLCGRNERHRRSECLLPQLQPAELWRESGRWDTYTQAEGIMFALTDRQKRELGLGPTHEEVITTIARDMIRSYRQLPLHLYQIQTKFGMKFDPGFLPRARIHHEGWLLVPYR